MKFFIDTANVNEIRAANDMGVIAGVTTTIKIVYRAFYPAIFHIVPTDIIIGSHPSILKRTELTIIKGSTICLTIHSQSLRTII